MPKRYPMLYAIGLLYKILAFLSFLTTTGAVFYSVSNTLRATPSGANAMQVATTALVDALPVAVAGFILMITFYAFAQVIDLLLTFGGSLRALVAILQEEREDKSKSGRGLFKDLLED